MRTMEVMSDGGECADCGDEDQGLFDDEILNG